MIMQWINVKKQPPRKDIPILVICELQEMPNVVKWLEDGTYGEPGFFESNEEYETKEEHILYWMPAPTHPFPYQVGEIEGINDGKGNEW